MTRKTLVWLVSGLMGVVPLWGQIPEAPIRGFTLPLVDRETLELKARVRGELAQPVDRERIEIQGLRLESLGDSGETNLVITTEQCLLLVGERRLASPAALRMATGDGRLRLSGEGFSWGQEEGLVVSNRVDAELERPPAEQAEPGSPGPEDAPAAGASPIRIRSSEFRYQPGAAAFSGGVQVAEGADRLACRELRLGFRIMPGELAPAAEGGVLSDAVERIEAEGSVEVETADLAAQADRGVYDLTGDTVQLTGHARWRSGEREGEAEEILLDRRRGRLLATGGVRVLLPATALGGGATTPEKDEGAGGGSPSRVEARAQTLEIEPDPAQTGLSVATFRDRVELNQADGGMSCEFLQVRYRGSTPSVREANAGVQGPVLEGVGAPVEIVDARAEGGVRLWQGTNLVHGVRAVYTAATGRVDVDGPVTWELEGRTGRSDRLRLHVVERMTEALGDVQMQLPTGTLRSVDQILAAGSSTAPQALPESDVEIPQTSPQPVDIRCQDVRFRPAGPGRPFGSVDFGGGVQVQSGEGFSLRSDRMLTEIPPGTKAIHRLVAAGRVEIQAQDAQGRRSARGDRAEYLGAEDMLWLTGDDGVTMELEDKEGTHRGRGRLAVYDGRRGVLELRTGAVVDSAHGRLTGDVVRIDRISHVLAAGEGWRLRIPVRGEGVSVAVPGGEAWRWP